MKEKDMRFYEQPLLTWIFLFLFPPIGIILLWLVGHFDLFVRIILSFIFGLLFLEFVGVYSSLIRAAIYSLIIYYLLYKYQKIKEYVEQINFMYQDAQSNLEIQNIFNNYLLKFESPTHCFSDLLAFELHLRKTYPIVYTHLTLSHKEDTFTNIIYEPSNTILKKEKDGYVPNEDDAKNEKYLTELIQLSDIVSDHIQIKGEQFKLYFTFSLLKDLSIDYYADYFNKMYGKEFIDDNLLNLEDAVLQYVSIDAFNTDINSKDLAMFTYFLMKYGLFKQEKDFYTCIKKIHGKISDELEERKHQLFKKHLFYSKEELIKEIESIEQVGQMNSSKRFKEYIQDLLQGLGYTNIQETNQDLDYIVTLNQHAFGIKTIYHTEIEKDKNVSVSYIQDMKLGLAYHKLEKGIIITDKEFTPDAINLAEVNQIVLWDKTKLKEKANLTKRYYQERKRKEPKDETKFDDISSIPYDLITIETIDKMTGQEFQYYLAETFKRKGYKIIEVKRTKDKGIDVILERNSLKFGIQVKRSSTPIGREVIKEVVSGLPYYNLQVGYAITNNTFSEEAVTLAGAFDIILWDRNHLIKEINHLRRKWQNE